jgi:thiamine biosynthesis protein ThiI
MKFVSLISSGIDSPVATYLVSKKAKEIILVHGDIRPFTDDREIQNFINLAKYLKKIISCEVKDYVLLHGENLSVYKKNCNNRFTCVFCKRMLLRYAEKIAEIEYADAIVMGDSLGQVASQTLHNIGVIDQAVSMPVIRPNIGLDKNDIVNIAKEIGTYGLSIQPSNGCSAVPKKPSTSANLDSLLKEEEKIDVNELVHFVVKNSTIVSL